MKTDEIERRRSEGQIVKITCSGGELLEAKILHVDDEYRDAVYELVSSSTPQKYPRNTATAYVVRWDDIVDFR